MSAKVTAEQMNQIAKVLGTDDKNVVISAVITVLVESGLKMNEAFDAVFGEGAYKKFAGEIYHALRAQAA